MTTSKYLNQVNRSCLFLVCVLLLCLEIVQVVSSGKRADVGSVDLCWSGVLFTMFWPNLICKNTREELFFGRVA